MRALAYAWQEAVTSLARARWTLLLSIATIAVAFAMLGAFRVVSGTVERVAGGWSEAAEVSVYLDDVVTEAEQAAIRQVIDRCVPLASGASIALATNDVYQYLDNVGIRDEIEAGVRQALQPDVPTVVVAHSLGTVVAYNLLRREGQAQRWNVPLFVTLGSPLAVTAVRAKLAPNRHPPCVGRWFNALDERDVVALYPLDAQSFPIEPPIVNKRDVDNPTSNRHGISGYLSDPEVAKWLHDALIA